MVLATTDHASPMSTDLSFLYSLLDFMAGLKRSVCEIRLSWTLLYTHSELVISTDFLEGTKSASYRGHIKPKYVCILLSVGFLAMKKISRKQMCTIGHWTVKETLTGDLFSHLNIFQRNSSVLLLKRWARETLSCLY